MAYAVKQDMINRFGEPDLVLLTDRAGLGIVGDAVLASALSEAESIVNGYIQVRYSLPISPIPPALTRAACDIAAYNLMPAPTEIRTKRYDDAMKWLRDVAAGRAMLGSDTAASLTPPGQTDILTETKERTFTSDTLADYKSPGEGRTSAPLLPGQIRGY